MKAGKFTGAIFLCVIMSFMCMAPISLIVKQTNKRADLDRVYVKIDWAKLYPFSDNKTDAGISRKEPLFRYVKRTLTNYTSSFLLGYDSIVGLSKKYEDAIGWNIALISGYNSVVQLDDGYLTTYTPRRDVSQNAASLKELADFCAEKGADFMYINLPGKICISEDKDISGALDFTNQNANKLLSLLEKYGMKHYDFSKALHDDGMNHHNSFYRTDHHWKTEVGLWAAGHVLKILRDDFGWNVDPGIIAPENFRYVVYPEWFLGSLGRKMTLMRAKPEDFTLIYPKFETRIKFEIPNMRINKEGDLGVIYDMRQVESKDYYGKSPYEAYFYGGNALVSIENQVAMNGKKVLFIHDSFASCVIPFFAIGIQHTYSIDLRMFIGSVHKFIEVEKPDAVIVIYYSLIPGNNKFYDFR